MIFSTDIKKCFIRQPSLQQCRDRLTKRGENHPIRRLFTTYYSGLITYGNNGFLPILAMIGLLLLAACDGPKAPEDKTGNEREVHQDTAGPVEYRGKVPLDTLREDTADSGNRALLSKPPDYDTSAWTELQLIAPDIENDLRYATDSNFVGEQLYECGRCFLRPEVAKAVAAAQRELQQRGLGLKMFDCYRPLPIQWKLWEKVSTPGYVADPKKGSVHNRGGAVDLTIVDRQGNALAMGTPYDFFGRKAYHTYTALPDSVLANRQMLKELMEAHGFRSIRTEWWHYSYTKKNYPISDMMWNCPDSSIYRRNSD